MCKNLEAEGIRCTLILDSAIGYIMDKVNFIMVGAEAVVESGGIVNKVYSFFINSMIIVYLLSNKCVYVGGNIHNGSVCT